MKIDMTQENGLLAEIDNPTKVPWFLRFVPGSVKPKEMAATAGFAVIYGLLFAGILLAPLLPHLAAQSNSPTNNTPTNSVHRDVFYNNNEFRDANSREDCDRILQDVLKKIKETTKEINKNWKAAEECDITYKESLKTNNLNHLASMAQQAKSKSDEIFWECFAWVSEA